MSQCDFLTIVKINLNFHIITKNVPLYLGVWLCISRFQINFFQIMLFFLAIVAVSLMWLIVSHEKSQLRNITHIVIANLYLTIADIFWDSKTKCYCLLQEINSKSRNIKSHCNCECLPDVTLYFAVVTVSSNVTL